MPIANLIGGIFSIGGSFPRHVQVSVKLTKTNQHCGPKCQITPRFVWALWVHTPASHRMVWASAIRKGKDAFPVECTLYFPIRPLPPLTARGHTPVCSEYPQALRPALISPWHFLSPCLGSSPWSHSVPISSSVLYGFHHHWTKPTLKDSRN